ncbi:protein kinase domain-containing protein [Sulfuriroseicoccus oceanibius]|uniref:Protein kinase n=1 Tax=Sulfuriroseicoccus oceanibius TaxID=2707525 RepID=A0A6B3LCW6_9BACT|nr:protein kinase [Sulfuriroseicoccus oceanibius]QQL45982.1 protein kinase [Sulfuriroseicoccus oceanibius]
MSERYQIKSKIGQGGIGAVYRALDTHLQREVAIKRLLPPDESESFDEDPTQGLIREATTLSTLQHPNIVSVYDVGQDDDGAFVVMELVDGETFEEVVQRGLLTLEDFNELVGQSLEALIAAQDKNLVHRDIKPTNLMVKWLPSGRFQFKLLDFGLAKFSPRPSKQTIGLGDSILGSIHFMAPEQFERRPLDCRTDLYAIGCIYYFGLTGRYPFDGETAAEVMAAHLQHSVTPLEEHRPDIPRRFTNWVMWMISREVEDRPKDAKHALDVFLNPNANIPGASSGATGRLVVPAGAVAGAATPGTGAVNPGTSAYVNPATGQIATAGGTGPVHPGTGQVSTATGAYGAVAPGGGPPKWTISTGPVTGATQTVVGGGKPVDMKKRWALIGGLSLLALVGGGSLLGMLLGESDEEKLATVVALMESDDRTGGDETVKLLLPYLNPPKKLKVSDRDALLQRVEDTLKELEGPGVDTALMNALDESTSTKVRESLMTVLVNRKVEDAKPMFLEIALRGDEDPASEWATQAYGFMTDDVEGTIDLIDLLATTESSDVRREAEKRVRQLMYEFSQDKRSRLATTLAEGVDPINDLKSRQACVRLLGMTGTGAAADKLNSLLKSTTDQELHLSALTGLGEWPDDSQVEALFELASNGPSPEVENGAFKAYIMTIAQERAGRDDDQWRSWWTRAFTLSGSDTNRKMLMVQGLAGVGREWSLDLLDQIGADPRFSPQVRQAKSQVRDALSK